MNVGAFRGATSFEAYAGPFWITILRPSFWRSTWRARAWAAFVRVGLTQSIVKGR